MSGINTEYVLVTQYFHPDTASTGQLMTNLAVGLQKRGLDMTVYTTHPNYHSGNFDKQPRKENHEGVDVTRIRAPQLNQTSFPRRAFNWVVYTIWMAIVLLSSQSDRDRKIVFVSNPPFFGIPMWIICRLRGWEYTYIVYDLWPEKGIEFGFYRADGIIDRLWSYFHRKVLIGADTVVTLGPKMRENILAYAPGELNDKVEIIHNWADGDFLTPKKKSENWFSDKYDLVDRFALLYSGNIGLFHDLETVIRACQSFTEEEFQFLVIGEGDNKEPMASLAEKLNVYNKTVNFLPYQPYEDLPYSLTCADITVVTVQKGFEGTCVSSKLYTALATGQPVLIIAQPYADEAHIVKKHDAGAQVAQGDIDTVIKQIRKWKSNPELLEKQAKNAREAFEDHYTKEKSIDAYYETLTGERSEMR